MPETIRICIDSKGKRVQCRSYNFDPLSCRRCTCKPVKIDNVEYIKTNSNMKEETVKKMGSMLTELINEVGAGWTKINSAKLMKRCNASSNAMTFFVKQGILEKEREGKNFSYRIAPGFKYTNDKVLELAGNYSDMYSQKNKTEKPRRNIIPDYKHTPSAPPKKQIVNNLLLTMDDKKTLLKLAHKAGDTHLVEKLIDAL